VSRHATSLTLPFPSMKAGASRPGTPSVSESRAATSFDEEFQACYRERFGPLFSYLDRLTGDPEAASDAAQEAFVRLHQRGSMPDQPGAWLVTVANNLVRGEHRRVTRQLRLLTQNPEPARLGARAGDPAQDLEQAERVRAIRAALGSLKPRYRQALLMRHSGYSYREIGAALRLAKGGVGTTLIRAGQMFRAAFKEMHGAPE